MRFSLLASLLLLLHAAEASVTHTPHHFLIDGKPTLIMAGHIHYPRIPPTEWRSVIRASKHAGLNAIDTYVFWAEHEPERGQYNFTKQTSKDLLQFLEIAKEEEMYVVLRFGPYVCAEYNYGGFPVWIREVPNIDIRAFNEPFKHEMRRFLQFFVSYTQEYFHTNSNGGPVILLQVENEYGLVEKQYGHGGYLYAQWASAMARNITTSLPWFMCVADNVPSLINTCNGFACHEWISTRPYRSHPAMFTEHWLGWFTQWSDIRPLRRAEDVAYTAARFYAAGGTYNAYYMWHGGTNFGRQSGYGISTSYDYDAPLDEWGMQAEPKYGHLARLNWILRSVEGVLLEGVSERVVVGEGLEVIIYAKQGEQVWFLINSREVAVEDVEFRNVSYAIPAWSVSIYHDGELLYNTATLAPGSPVASENVFTVLSPHSIVSIEESVYSLLNIRNDGKFDISTTYSTSPLEQIAHTRDKTDYLKHTLSMPLSSSQGRRRTLLFAEVRDHVTIRSCEYSATSRGGKNISFSIPPQNSECALVVITSTLGLTNFGPHLQEYARGIMGDVFLDGEDITLAGWQHEYEVQTPTPGGFTQISSSGSVKPFRYYRLNISLPIGSEEEKYFALDLSTLSKGIAWVNGNMIGRYWNITSSMPNAPTNPYPKPEDVASAEITGHEEADEEWECTYIGTYNADKCRNPALVGTLTQRYYRVPAEWLVRSEGGVQSVVVFDEEGGGDLEGVLFVGVSRKEIHGGRKEGQKKNIERALLVVQ